ncbi:MAG: CHAT domain-containing protein [Tepidisphaera sp.]|nr:CHAT domain-containing protein [Tepidisphaera sp.]
MTAKRFRPALVLCLALGGCVSGIPEVVKQFGQGDMQAVVTGVEARYGSAEQAPALESTIACLAYYQLHQYAKFRACSEYILAQDDPSFETYPGMEPTRQNPAEVKASIHNARAQMYFDFLQFDQSIEEADQSLALIEQTSEPVRRTYLRIAALEPKALSLVNLGRADEVGPLIETIEAQQSSIPVDRTELAKTRQSALAKIYFAEGDYASAREVLEQHVLDPFGGILKTPALVFRDLENGADSLAMINTLPKVFMLNKAMLETGDVEAAKAGYDELLANPVTRQFGDFYWIALVDRARIHWQEGEREQAIDQLEQAIDVIEAQRSTIQSDAFKIGFVGDKQKAYRLLVKYLAAEHRSADAFEYVERAKARALVDMLASKQQFANAPAATVKALGDLDDYELALASASVRRDVGSATRTRGLVREARRTVAQQDPQLASLVTVSAPDPQALQARLGGNEVILEYFGSGDELFAFVVSRDRISAVPLDGTGLVASVRAFRQEILDLDGDSYLGDAQALYRRLIAPVHDLIRGKSLIIVPHGPLHYLPFAALHDGKSFLIDEFRYRVLPSASVLTLLRSRGGDGQPISLLALGNPDLGDPQSALPGAEREVEALAQLEPASRVALRGKASETLLKRFGDQAKYLHIASHGQFNAAHPLASRLLLAPDAENDGNLTVGELYDLHLDADLVVLSACQTGLGDVQSGDDVIGLTRGFLYAGASNIIASLWFIDDRATSMLMANLYAHLDTTDKETALRDAQRYIKDHYDAHPYYWAAFQLTGSG